MAERRSRPGCLLRAAAILAIAALVVVRFGNDAARALESDAPSVSTGTPGSGSLRDGKRLPTAGRNFAAYSWLGALAGRNAVHHEVRDIVLAAYAAVEAVARFPAAPWNKFGYDLEFDATGAGVGLTIDFAAMAAHLVALDAAARERGARLELVIFAPELQQALFATEAGARLKTRLPWSTKPAWVRHDEHYHVNFRL